MECRKEGGSVGGKEGVWEGRSECGRDGGSVGGKEAMWDRRRE